MGRESYGRNLRSLRMQGKPWNFKTGSEAYAPDFVYILVFTLAISYLIEAFGMERLSGMLMGNTLFQPMIAALIGLIPNCGASVALTQLYLGGAISFASVIAGLCTGAGVGLLVLFRVNQDKKRKLENSGTSLSAGSRKRNAAAAVLRKK